MAVRRGLVVDGEAVGFYHCVSRCVRRAFLCGQDGSGVNFDHRRSWIRDRLRYLTSIFAVDVAGYAVMSNHMHVVIRLSPQAPLEWDAYEVARRWLLVYPSAYHADGSPKPPEPAHIRDRSQDEAFITSARQRLGSLSWFMRALKEPIARRANRENDCTGAFWEGRFTSVALLDEAAILSCMAYVDLNPIRARIAETPETSTFTSAYERIAAASRAPIEVVAPLPGLDRRQENQSPWLLPLDQCGRAIDQSWYFTLLDCSGRVVRGDKSGSIAEDLPPLLERLGISPSAWHTTMTGRRQMQGSALGHAAARISEAVRRGCRWLSSRCAAFAGQQLTE